MNNLNGPIKYLVYGVIIYFIFAFIPKNKIALSDMLVITSVIVITFVLLDFVLNTQSKCKTENFNNKLTDLEDNNNIYEGLEDDNIYEGLDGEEDNIVRAANDNVTDFDTVSPDDNDDENIRNKTMDTDVTTTQEAIKEKEILPPFEISNDDSDLDRFATDDEVAKIDKQISFFVDSKKTISQYTDILIFLSKLLKNKKIKRKDFKDIIESCNNIMKNNKTVCIESIINLFEKGIISKSDQDYMIKLLDDNYKYEKKLEKISKTSEDMLNLQKKLLGKDKLSDDEILNLQNMCSTDEEKCKEELLKLKVANRINQDDLNNLMVTLGYKKNNFIRKLFVQGKINEKDLIELGHANLDNVPSYFFRSIVERHVADNKLTNSEGKNLLYIMDKNDRPTNSGVIVVGNLLKENTLNIKQSNNINNSCISDVIDSCDLTLRRLVADKILNTTQAYNILQAYSKPATAHLFTKKNRKYASGDRMNDLSNINPKDNLSYENLSKIKSSENSSMNDSNSNFNSNMNKSQTNSVDNLESDLAYNQLKDERMKPLGEYTKDFTNDFEYGYSYLHTDKWRTPMPKVPVCKQETTCGVCPLATSGYPVDVKEWNNSRRIMPPDNINIDYIKDKLNSGS